MAGFTAGGGGVSIDAGSTNRELGTTYEAQNPKFLVGYLEESFPNVGDVFDIKVSADTNARNTIVAETTDQTTAASVSGMVSEGGTFRFNDYGNANPSFFPYEADFE